VRVPSSNGVELAVHDLGGEGRPVLLAHATGFHGHVWLPLVGELGPGFHCFALDMRGHGDSTAPDPPDFDWHGFADDVLAAVDALDLAAARPLAVGHSKGAAALLLAEAARPGTFARLYCFEPVVIPVDPPPPPGPNPLSDGALRRREVFPSRAEALATFSSKPPLSALRSDALRAYVDWGFDDQPDGTVRLKCRPEHEAATYTASFAHGAYGRLPGVACPVTVACGSETDAISAAIARRLAAALPSATVSVLPGLGHFGPLQDPAAVAADIRAALGAPAPAP
jgi:pimeloyl-ACP methyl ester carboxylesterase